MQTEITPFNKTIKGKLIVPASKSVSQRVLALSLLVNGKTEIYNLGESDDEKAALDIIQQAGAKVNFNGNRCVIHTNKGRPTSSNRFNVHESGLSTRMFTPILANSEQSIIIDGEGSILSRPMHFFEETLNHLNVNISTKNGCLPLHLKGPLRPQSIPVDGSLSSQFITGLTYGFVASPFLKKAKLKMIDLKSKPYLDLSLDVLRLFGVDLVFAKNTLHFEGPYTLKETTIDIEGDWSSVSFFLVLASIQGEIEFTRLNKNSKQADIAIIEALEEFGANCYWENDSLFVKKKKLQHFTFDATHCPDLFPPLAALAVFGNAPSRIKGVHRLLHKESNRADSIEKEWKKMGCKVTINTDSDEMIVFPEKKIKGNTVSAQNDHRIAMALSILGLHADDQTIIKGSESVRKSFPSFFEVLNGFIP